MEERERARRHRGTKSRCRCHRGGDIVITSTPARRFLTFSVCGRRGRGQRGGCPSAGRELKKLPPPWGELMCWRARATCWWEVNLCVRFGRSPFCGGQRRGKCALRGLPSQAKLLARADQSRATSPPEPSYGPGLTRLSTARLGPARGFKPVHASAQHYMPRRVFHRDRCNLSTCHHPLSIYRRSRSSAAITTIGRCTTASRTYVQCTNGPGNHNSRIMIRCI